MKKGKLGKNGTRKRTDPQKLWDRMFIAEKRMQGWTLERITAGLNETRAGLYTLNQASVHLDLQGIEQQWKASILRDIDTAKGRELAELDRLGDEAWQAWERSKAQYRQATVIVDGVAEGDGAPPKKRKSKIVTEDQHGDPRFMDTILRIQDRRAKILGLNAPITVANPDGSPLAAGQSLAPIVTVVIAPPPAT